MFNRKYNQQPYNRKLNDLKDIFISMSLLEELNGWMSIGADYYERARLSEQLQGNATVAIGIPSPMTLTESLNGNVDVITGVSTNMQLQENLGGTSHLGATIYQYMSLGETLNGTVHLGATIYEPTTLLVENLNGKFHLGATIYENMSVYETLIGYLSIADIIGHILTYGGSMAPGDSLVVDSDAYTAFLNGNNVIHLQGGDKDTQGWHMISRDTVDFTLQANNANGYTWEVFYIARYL